MDYLVKLTAKEFLTHNVIRFRLEKPQGFLFTAGQAVEVTLNEPTLKGVRSPFTLTCLNSEPYLELIFKVYAARKGMTLALSKKKAGDVIVVSDPWDSFKIKGPGIFIAGGTGITPFIAILKQLKVEGKLAGSQLLFSNKTQKDVFLQAELTRLLGDRYLNVITRENRIQGEDRRINQELLEKYISDFSQPCYICGPENFVEHIQGYLTKLGAGIEMINLSL